MANTPNDKNRDPNADKSGIDANHPNRQNPDRSQENPNRQQQAEQAKQGQQGAGATDPNRAKQQGTDNMKKPEQR
jgi:hypothetical protein